MQDSLRPGQAAEHRFDIISRVFHLKVAELMRDLRDGVLGKHIGHIYCVEWQKRGLPHVHILLFFVPEDKLTTPEDYDDVVCAEIPDKDKEPELHEKVMRLMIHTPCVGHDPKAPCITDKECSRRFPKQVAANICARWTVVPKMFTHTEQRCVIGAVFEIIRHYGIGCKTLLCVLKRKCHCGSE